MASAITHNPLSPGHVAPENWPSLAKKETQISQANPTHITTDQIGRGIILNTSENSSPPSISNRSIFTHPIIKAIAVIALIIILVIAVVFEIALLFKAEGKIIGVVCSCIGSLLETAGNSQIGSDGARKKSITD